MGIRSLQSFMTQHVPGGFVDVSIIEECQKYSKSHKDKKPTIVIDVNGFMAILNRDTLDMLYGRSHRKCYQTIDNLFRRLSEVADLVFYRDGPVVDQKGVTIMSRRNDHYKAVVEVIDMVNQHTPIEKILEDWKNGWKQFPSIGSGFEFLSMLACKYGQYVVSVTKECDAEIAQFACKNPSVIAVIAEDSDFLIFPGKWRYFSTHSLNLENLSTKEYSRSALRRYLNLYDFEMAILATIAGNDVVKYDEVSHCHGRRIGNMSHYKDPSKFTAFAEKVQTFDGWNDHGLISYLAQFLLRDKSDESKRRIAESLDQYSVKFPVVDSATPLLKFFRENYFDYVYSVLQKKSFCMVVGFNDRRDTSKASFHGALEQLIQRQMGVVLQHQQKTSENLNFDIYAKKSHEELMTKHLISPVYPEFEIPSLIELLDRKNHPELDEVRFDLLKWTISETLKDFGLTAIPKAYLRHVLSLYFMVAEGFITVLVADIILLTIKDAVQEKIPEDYEYPPIVDPAAFQIAFLYLDFFMDLQRSFEVAGLADLSTHQTFEGGYFHALYLQFSESGKNPANDLKDLENFRIYKELTNKPSTLG